MPIQTIPIKDDRSSASESINDQLHSREYNRRKLQLVDSFRRIKPQARGSHDVSIHRANIRANWLLRGRIRATKVQLSLHLVARNGEGRWTEPGESTEGRLFREFLPKSWSPSPPIERALEDPAGSSSARHVDSSLLMPAMTSLRHEATDVFKYQRRPFPPNSPALSLSLYLACAMF